MIFSIGISISLFMGFLLLLKRRKSLADFILLIWLILMAIHLLFFYAVFDAPDEMIFLIGVAGYGLIILYTPLLYLYSATVNQDRLPRFWYFHFLFYFFFVVFIGYFGLVNPASYIFKFGFLKIKESEPFLLRQYGIYVALVTFIYSSLIVMRSKKHDREVKSYLSFDERINLRWLKQLSLLAILFFVSIFLLIMLSVQTNVPSLSTTFKWVGFFITLYIIAISLFGLRQSTIFLQPVDLPNKKDHQYRNSGMTKESVELLADRLSTEMIAKRYYLNAQLSLPVLAEKFGVSTANLSQTINQSFGRNFFDFVNEFRVKEFKMRVNDPAYGNFTLLGIALECGFSSKSSFNKVFKRITGQSPSSLRAK